MKRKNRDSKFIIYQVLYIFVITVLAMKGADLDLKKVISKDAAVSKTVRDSLMVVIDSLYAQGQKFQIKVDPNTIVENEVLRKKLSSLNEQLANIKPQIASARPVAGETNPPQPVQNQKPAVSEQTILQSPISIKETFLQNTWNVAKNTGNVQAALYDPNNMNSPIVVIPPNQQVKFDLKNETKVVLKYGSQQQELSVLPMHPPEIKIDRATTKMDGSTIYVQDLQRVTDFTVTIKYDRPDQLKITHTGPIAVSGPFKNSKGDYVYNVSLKIASTNQRYQEWLDHYGNLRDANGRHKADFFFTAADQISKANVVIGDTFYFTDFER
jgi:hypothetical protein